MQLDLDRQGAGRTTLDIDGELDLALGGDRPRRAALRGRLTVDNVSRRFLVTGELTAAATTACSRCLDGFVCEVAVPVEIQVLTDPATDEGEDDSLVIHQQRGEVDLAGPLRESVALAWPQAPVCREDCRGLCPHCGIDRNEDTCSCAEDDHDPRWDGLP